MKSSPMSHDDDDCGGELSFNGQDPILPSPLGSGQWLQLVWLQERRVAALWRQATGEGQNISVDVRKDCGFLWIFEGKWETSNGRPPSQVAMQLAHS